MSEGYIALSRHWVLKSVPGCVNWKGCWPKTITRMEQFARAPLNEMAFYLRFHEVREWFQLNFQSLGYYWNGHFTDSLTEIYRKEKLLYIGCLHILFNLTSFSMTDSGNFALRSVSMTVNIYYHTNGKLQAPVQMIRSREFQLASRWRGLRFGWNILPSFRASVVPTSSSSSPPVNKSRVKLPPIGSTRAEHGRKENVQGADMGGQNEGVITNVRSRRTCVSYYLNC